MALATPALLAGTHWFLFVVIISFIATLIWIFVYLLSVREALNLPINWYLTVCMMETFVYLYLNLKCKCNVVKFQLCMINCILDYHSLGLSASCQKGLVLQSNSLKKVVHMIWFLQKSMELYVHLGVNHINWRLI